MSREMGNNPPPTATTHLRPWKNNSRLERFHGGLLPTSLTLVPPCGESWGMRYLGAAVVHGLQTRPVVHVTTPPQFTHGGVVVGVA